MLNVTNVLCQFLIDLFDDAVVYSSVIPEPYIFSDSWYKYSPIRDWQIKP